MPGELLIMHEVSAGGSGAAAAFAETSSGGLGAAGSRTVVPESARKRHLTIGAAPVEPKPAFSRYDTTVNGQLGSTLKAANVDESFQL